MHAVILAGGKGVRLRPYTTALPKPLVQAFHRRRDFRFYHIPLSYFGAMTAFYAVAGLFFMTLGFDISTTVFALTTALVSGLYMRTQETSDGLSRAAPGQ